MPGEEHYLAEGIWNHNSGKTRSGAQALVEIILADTAGDGQYGIVAPTYRDAWTVCVEGESGLLAALGTTAGEIKQGTSKTVLYAHRSYGEIGLKNGHTIFIDSADDGALRVQGKNLSAAWCSEIGLWEKWDTAWNESIRYAVRKGVSVVLADGTPKASRPARALVRSLIRNEPEHGGVIVRRLRTIDNIANLSRSFYRAVVGASKGTRLERQELEGELLDDVPNALWTRDQLEAIQVPPVGGEGGIGFLHRAIIGVDPSDGNETSDEQAYTVAGLGGDLLDTLYVAENWGGQEAPAAFARRVILKAVQWSAKIVVEKNHGGEWLRSTFRQVMKELVQSGRVPADRQPPVVLIWASLAKRVRAEPVSALYERGVVRHCKMTEIDSNGKPFSVSMIELEDQLCTFTAAAGERSPDRLDSLVWSCTPFLNSSFAVPGPAGRRDWAAKAEMGDFAPDGPALGESARKKIAALHGGLMSDAADSWSLEDFAPQDDREPEKISGPRGAVRLWR